MGDVYLRREAVFCLRGERGMRIGEGGRILRDERGQRSSRITGRLDTEVQV